MSSLGAKRVAVKRRWVQRGFVTLLVAISLVLGLYLAGRVSAVVFGRDLLFDWLRPTAADVLDGRVANEERLASIGEVMELSDELRVEGVAPVGKIVWTACGMGQNNYKVHDGYRLSCDARETSYLAWTGGYENAAEALRGGIAARCPDLELDPGPRPATPGAPTTVAIYRCSGRTQVMVVFSSTERMDISDSVLSIDPTAPLSRTVSGSSPERIFDGLSKYQWFAEITVIQVFYKDQP